MNLEELLCSFPKGSKTGWDVSFWWDESWTWRDEKEKHALPCWFVQAFRPKWTRVQTDGRWGHQFYLFWSALSPLKPRQSSWSCYWVNMESEIKKIFIEFDKNWMFLSFCNCPPYTSLGMYLPYCTSALLAWFSFKNWSSWHTSHACKAGTKLWDFRCEYMNPQMS